MAEDKTFKTFIYVYTYMSIQRLYLFKFQFIQKGPVGLCRIFFIPKNIALLYTEVYATCEPFFLISIVQGGVQLGPLGTAATNKPILSTPGDYDDGEIGGMMIGRANRSTRRKLAPVPLCPP
jgi:hypothetical protein